MINDRTTNLSLALPNENNALSDDVGRLRDALTTIDLILSSKASADDLSALVDAAPGALNTLNELAAALGDDANFAGTVTTSLAAKAPLASPTFTGTVSGITAAMVGAQPAGTYATGTGFADGINTGDQDLSGKQDVLVSGTNIRTINGQTLLGSTNLVIGSLTVATVTGTTQTAVSGAHYVLTNVAATTLTLPATPASGDIVAVTPANSLTTNVIARNGSTIMGRAEDMTLDNANATVTLRYLASTWRII